MFSRRDMLAVSAAGMMTATAARSASFGNPDQPPQGAINAKGPGNLTDPGPQNAARGFAGVRGGRRSGSRQGR